MKSKEPVHQQVKDTFKVLESIKEVKVNHFFKHNVLQQLKNPWLQVQQLPVLKCRKWHISFVEPMHNTNHKLVANLQLTHTQFLGVLK